MLIHGCHAALPFVSINAHFRFRAESNDSVDQFLIYWFFFVFVCLGIYWHSIGQQRCHLAFSISNCVATGGAGHSPAADWSVQRCDVTDWLSPLWLVTRIEIWLKLINPISFIIFWNVYLHWGALWSMDPIEGSILQPQCNRAPGMAHLHLICIGACCGPAITGKGVGIGSRMVICISFAWLLQRTVRNMVR